MKIKLAVVLLMILRVAALSVAADLPSIIPAPQKIEMREGAFQLAPETQIVADSDSGETGNFLAKRLRKATGYPFKISTSAGADAAVPQAILLTTNGARANLGAEGYELVVSSNAVVIRAPRQAGVFYGVQSLLQLLPPAIFGDAAVPNADWKVPCVQIEDQPRFPWRGLMLDVSRHFFTKTEVEQFLDGMALHKLNRFHWHLVDDPGWRIEIKKYPLLTQVGAWRSGIDYELDPGASTAYGRDGRYGGFYTQDDIREVVAYAGRLHITIVPEIEMPGHSSAVLTTYPQLSCFGGPYTPETWGGVYCAGKEETFAFLQDVLTEVFQLFPGKYIHIGGDEVTKDNWHRCEKCQARIREEKLKNEEQLQSYFIRRMEKFINARGHSLIGWSEILQGGLAPNAVVMDWIGGGDQAAREGHDVVMTPTGFCYLDYLQSRDTSIEPRAGGYLPLDRVYSFEPIPSNLAPEFASHILGGEGCVWTENIPSLKHAEYMAYPRACAIAEAVWSPKAARNWQDFNRRLKVHEQRLAQLGVNYRRDHSIRLGEWKPEMISTQQVNLEWDVTGKIGPVGAYHVVFDHRGAHGLKIEGVSLLEDEREIARDNHTGIAGSESRDPIYVLNLPAGRTDAHYVIQAKVTGYHGESTGVVWCEVPPVPHTVLLTNNSMDAKVSLDYPGFAGLALDRPGQHHFPLVTLKPRPQPWWPAEATPQGSRVEYRRPGAAKTSHPRWSIEIEKDQIRLESNWSEDDPPESLVLEPDSGARQIALVGKTDSADSIRLPAILHVQDQGSFQISVTPKSAVKSLGYKVSNTAKITFAPATREHPRIQYLWTITADPSFSGQEEKP